MPEETNRKWIKASPTKAFFIHVLTRDVPLARAILDLVDNSVDGARRERAAGDYTGLWVRLEASKEEFRIVDNCGGIPVRVAREYAFRFGRPTDAEETPGSIGQFGVGMKRSFFKLGREFMVESVTRDSRFRIEVDVEQWMSEDEDHTNEWHFEFAEVQEAISSVEPDQIGTRIVVRRLFESIGDAFELEHFQARLIDEISAAHSVSMDRGLAITLDGIPIRHIPHKLLDSEQLRPAFWAHSYPRSLIDGQEGAPVNVKLYAGVADRSLHEGGWYVFCNGRLVLRADQTSTTVWGPAHNIQQYHPDYAYFRGFAYFDSDHAALLPWTTTKTGVDVDSRIYQVVQSEMIELTKPVIEFLRRLEKERRAKDHGEIDDEPLRDVVSSAVEVRAETITQARSFVAPSARAVSKGPRLQRIQYSKPADLVDKAKRLLNVPTFTAVGERTFDYFLENEGEE